MKLMPKGTEKKCIKNNGNVEVVLFIVPAVVKIGKIEY